MTSSFAAFASQMLNRPSPPSNSNDEPMFFSFTSGGGGRSMRLGEDDDEEDPHLRNSEDPYLKLDDYDEEGARSRYDEGDEEDDYPEGGWLAHQGSPLLSGPSSSPSPPPLLPPPRAEPSMPGRKPPPGRQSHKSQQHVSLTASLLPQSSSHPVFSLPLTPARRPTTYNDFPYIAAYLVCICASIIACIVLLFSKPPNRADYKTLLHTIPLLTVLTVLAALLSYLHLFLLKVFAHPALLVSSLLVPVSLVICALWAFVGSFTYEGEPTWGESTGLRIFSLLPLVLAFFAFRNLDHLPRDIHSTTSMLELIVRVLRANPLLLGVSPALLVALWVASIPFVTILFRADMSVGWGTAAVVGTWLWTWGVARGAMRVVVAGVVGSHYFNPRIGDTRPLHAAAHRASQASLGSIILASLILTVIRLLGLLSIALGRLPVYTSIPFLLSFSRFAVRWLDTATSSLSKFALTWVGLTGEPFFPAARKSQVISAETMKRRLARPPTLRLLLTTPITLPLPAFLMLYLFVAHTLDAPNQALGVAVMGGGVTLLSAWMCVGLVRDIGDALWISFCLDHQEESSNDHRGRRNDEWREEVRLAFEYKPSQPPAQRTRRFPPPEPSTSSLPIYSPPRQARDLRSPTPPPLVPPPHVQQRQSNQASSTRHVQLSSSPEPEPEPVDVDDLDPFETETTTHSPPPTHSRSHSQVMAAASRPHESTRLPDSDSDSEDGGEVEGLFPGSGLFGSGLA